MKKTKFKENLSRAIKEIGNGSKIRGITLISLVIIIVLLLAYIVIDKNQNKTQDNQNIQALNSNENNNTDNEVLEKNEIAENEINEADETDEKINLTQSELDEFTEKLGAIENNGFIVGNYENVEDIDLYQVLYVGAGIAENENFTTIQKEFEEVNGEGLDIPITKMKASKIDEFLMKKTGKKYDLKTKLKNWVYNPKYDAYYHESGDTNITAVTCTSGYKQGSTYVINGNYGGLKYDNYSLDNDDNNNESNHKEYSGFTLTLKKVGDDFRFVSNIMK